MDCLRIMPVALALLGGLTGCQHSSSIVAGDAPPTTSAPLPASTAALNPSLVKAKEKESPPKPPVLVAAGQLLAGEAALDDKAPQRQAQLREQARLQYEKAIKIDPKHVEAYVELARLQVAMQDRAQAKLTYQKALKIAPRNPVLWYELGVCHNYDREWQPAVNCLREATRLDPRRREYVNAMAVVLARVGSYEESLALFERTSSEAEAHYRLSRTLQYLDQPELSRLHLQMALQKDPHLAPAQSMLAELRAPAARADSPEAVSGKKEVQQASAGGTSSAEPAAVPADSPGQPETLTAAASEPGPPASTPTSAATPALLPDLKVKPSSLSTPDSAAEDMGDRPVRRRRPLSLPPPMPSSHGAVDEPTAEAAPK